MRMIATKPEFGWKLSDLADACKQDRATVHRMLACLVQERMVEQRASDKHYLPGPLMYELGLAHTPRVQLHRFVESTLQVFARQMSGIALFLLRSGSEYVCSVRAGDISLSGLMVQPGTRRPLFTSAGGIAILQTLPLDEAQEILLNNTAQEQWVRGDSRLDALQKMRDRSDYHGFGVNLGDVVQGVHAFAVPVHDAQGQAFAALCLMGTAQRFSEDKLPQLRAALEETAAKLSQETSRLQR